MKIYETPNKNIRIIFSKKFSELKEHMEGN